MKPFCVKRYVGFASWGPLHILFLCTSFFMGSDPNVQQYPHGHNPNQLPTTGQRCTSWHTPLISIRYTSKYLQRINSSDAIPGRYFRTRSGCLGLNTASASAFFATSPQSGMHSCSTKQNIRFMSFIMHFSFPKLFFLLLPE